MTAARSFAELGIDDDLVAVLHRNGITEPFEIQAMAIPDALSGRDVCGKAQTGSGKTLAFGLPLIERTAPEGRATSMVLVPTRELATQVATELTPLAKARRLRIATVYGGVSIKKQVDASRHADVLVATPGRLIDLIDRKAVSIEGVKTVVIDEADRMADMGFLPQVHTVMRFITGRHQTMLFSATLDGQVRSLVTRYLADPVRHEVETHSEVVETQDHRFLEVHHMDKAKVAAAIAGSVDRALVFTETKRNADRVAAKLRKEGVEAAPIHGDLRQRDREKALGRFASGDLHVLVATNVAARGLHIDEIDVVIHYDPPGDYKDFLHRSGRTARAGETGLVVTLVEWDQMKEIEKLQRQTGLHFEIVKMFSNDPRLADLTSFQPETVAMKVESNAALSRRIRTRSYGRRR
jgi:superfamily II DNA/RNA helicase